MRFLILLLTTISINALAQLKLDSIQYPLGYLYFYEFGTGKPIIVLSGGPGISCQQEWEVAENIAKSHRAILFEQRGTGKSAPKVIDSSTVNFTQAKLDLLKLLNYLKIEKATFLGHSYGGILAMGFMADNPDKVESLILVGTGPIEIKKMMSKYLKRSRKKLNSSEKKKVDKYFENTGNKQFLMVDNVEQNKLRLIELGCNRNQVDEVYLKARNSNVSFNQTTRFLLLKSLYKENFNVSSALKMFSGKIYIIIGKNDPLSFVTKEIKKLNSNSEIFWIKNSGHFPMYEQPKDFYRVLNTILK